MFLHLNGTFFLQQENGLRYFVPPLGPLGRGDAVPLVVDEPPDLREVAVPLHEPVQHGGLAQEGEVAAQHALHPLLVGGHEHARVLALHVPAHITPLEINIESHVLCVSTSTFSGKFLSENL